MDEHGPQQIGSDVEGGAVEPAAIGQAGQKTRNCSISSGTKGRTTNPAIGINHSRNQLMMNDPLMMS